MAQRFNADSSMPDFMVLNNVPVGTYNSETISLLGVTQVSITYYSNNAVAGNLFFQVTDFDAFNSTTLGGPSREDTLNQGGSAATAINGPTSLTKQAPAAVAGAKWLRLQFVCSTAGSLRVAVTLKANQSS